MIIEAVYGDHNINKETLPLRGYAFESRERVKVGDVISVPGNEYRGYSPLVATVVRVGSDWHGYTKTVRRVIRRCRRQSETARSQVCTIAKCDCSGRSHAQ